MDCPCKRTGCNFNDTVIEHANNLISFLLCEAQLKYILEFLDPEDMLEALSNSVPRNLFDLYERAIERANRNSPHSKRMGMSILSWIYRARRPLTMAELQAAIAIRDGDMDKRALTPPEVIVEICAGLVKNDRVNDLVSFSHAIVREFLETRFSDHLWTETAVSNKCLTYLSFNTFENGECLDDESFQRRTKEFPFAQYSACYWGKHVKGVPETDSQVRQLLFALTQSPGKIMSMSQLAEDDWEFMIGKHKEKKLIHIIAENHLADLCHSPLTSESKVFP